MCTVILGNVGIINEVIIYVLLYFLIRLLLVILQIHYGFLSQFKISFKLSFSSLEIHTQLLFLLQRTFKLSMK